MPLKKLRGIFYMCKLTKFNIVRLSEVEVPQNDSAQFCHSEERGISASNSANKIANLCRVSYGDSSFLGMTNFHYKNFDNLKLKFPYITYMVYFFYLIPNLDFNFKNNSAILYASSEEEFRSLFGIL